MYIGIKSCILFEYEFDPDNEAEIIANDVCVIILNILFRNWNNFFYSIHLFIVSLAFGHIENTKNLIESTVN